MSVRWVFNPFTGDLDAVNKLRSCGAGLVGDIDGTNSTFSSPHKFVHQPGGDTIGVYYNGQRLVESDDYSVEESGGAGTGHDTVVLLIAPKSGDKLTADYTRI